MDTEDSSTERFTANAYYTFFPFKSQPNESELIEKLNNNYPETNIDWSSAVQKTKPEFLGDQYHFTMDVPIIWTIAYPNESLRPEFEDQEALMSFIQTQKGLLEIVENIGIPQGQFRWTSRNINHTMENGNQVPALKVVGLCTILCVVEPLVEENEEGHLVPFVPEINDINFYGTNK